MADDVKLNVNEELHNGKFYDTLNKLFEVKTRLYEYRRYMESILIKALYTGEQYIQDHKKSMSHEEKVKWVREKMDKW